MDEGYRSALRRFGTRLRAPKGIVAVSAHWQVMRPLRATGSRLPGLLRDYEGFPAWVDALTWDGRGSPALADHLCRTLSAAGIPALTDAAHGLDSATWIPLSLMFPSAQSPVVQLSLPAASSPEELVRIGQVLGRMRSQGYMIAGSGGVVHNASRVRFDRRDAPTEPWAVAFDNWVAERLDALDTPSLLEYRTRGPHAHIAAPTSEHLDPLFIVLGAVQPGDRVAHLYEGFHAGNLSLRSFALIGRRATDARLPDGLTAGAAA